MGGAKENATLNVHSTEHFVASDSPTIKLREIVEYVEKKNRILVGLILVNLIQAFLSPVLPYWISVCFSIVIALIAGILGFRSFTKVREIRSS
jgi:hypothetical protein